MTDIKNYLDVACEVFGMSKDELMRYVNMSTHDADIMVRNEWNRINPISDEEIIKWYKECNAFSLFHIRLSWGTHKGTCDPGLFNLLKNFIDVNKLIEFKILDYGCGSASGGLGLYNSGCKNVYFADVRTPLFEIAKRALGPWIGMDRFIEIKDKYPLDGMDGIKYDLIICADVFEHVVNPDLLLKYLVEHINRDVDGSNRENKNGYIYMTAFFGASDYAPCHLKENCEKFNPELWKKIIRDCGLIPVHINEGTVYDGLYTIQ